MTDDIVARLRSLNRCIRCSCQSCASGYENHNHICTDGPGCVKPLEKRLRAAIVLGGQAADSIEAERRRALENGMEVCRLRNRLEAAEARVREIAQLLAAGRPHIQSASARLPEGDVAAQCCGLLDRIDTALAQEETS